MTRLWSVLSEEYGHKFVSQYGAEPCDTWVRRLSDLTPEQILCGINALESREDEWPPGAVEFKKLCKGHSGISPDGTNSGAYRLVNDEMLRLPSEIQRDFGRKKLAEIQEFMNA